MQTVLGANGQIAQEIAKELHDQFTTDIRMVSRTPSRVSDTDELVSADLLDPEQADHAIEGSEIVYYVVGLPMNSQLWEQRFPLMLRNVIAACTKHHAKLVYFDNTYMYPGTATPQMENTRFAPNGRKGQVRAELARMLLAEMERDDLDVVICRAPEFYGPGKTQSISNSLFFNRLRDGKVAFVPLNSAARRSLIWTPDAGRATALIGNTPDAFNQTWHLPVDPTRLPYRQMAQIATTARGHKARYVTIPRFVFAIAKRFNPQLAELWELLPRYRQDNIFVSRKFEQRFPDFQVTSFERGITELVTASTPQS